ncbi:hypothetical protein A9Q87_01060 [Flavobacteriales bacterium 34_180_T64]|nr:hypothetical protein A9Q87_01060 [Flavobacteriales bacterium 34_180_T64]
MKKKVVIFCAVLTTLSLTAFGVINWNSSESNTIDTTLSAEVVSYDPVIEKIQKPVFTDFIYSIGPRFGGITKGVIENAKSIDAILNEDQLQRIMSLKSVEIIIIKDEKQSEIRVKGFSRVFTDAQLKLLQTFDYSTNFSIRAEYEHYNKETGELENSYSTPYHTIVPESQASYSEGKEALMTFLKDETVDVTAIIDAKKLRPAKLYFTVTKSRTIDHVKIDNPSGYPEVDKKMIELISKLPGTWTPAENANGEKVDQELVVSFGLMGC